jgi:hypothetical protein
MEPSCRTLDGFARESNGKDGVGVYALDAGSTLIVKTRHSRYRLTVLDGSRQLVLAAGGIFPEPTVVRLSGATFGGSTLKVGWILVGLRIEFGLGAKQITSSPVQSVEIEEPAAEISHEERAA